MYIGHRYTIDVENASMTSAIQDIIEMDAAATVPFLFEAAILTGGTIAQNIGRVRLAKRSSTGTGGTPVTPRPLDPAGPAASTVCNYLVTAPGGSGNTYGPQQWNLVTPCEWNFKPGGIFVAPGERLSIVLVAALGLVLPISLMIEFREYK